MGAKNAWTECGRAIGEASGWDQGETFSLMLYNFVPAKGYTGPTGDIRINFEKGTIETFNEDGSVSESVDLIGTIKHLPVKRID